MSVYIAKTGLVAQEKQLASISNNLANINTFGYHKKRIEFEELTYQTLRSSGAQTSDDQMQSAGVYIGTGVNEIATIIDFSQGQLVSTERDLDLAIEGKGFFQVLLPDGSTGYTRNGSWQRSEEGELVNAQGHVLYPNIQVPPETVELLVASDGTVNARIEGQIEFDELGQIELAYFSGDEGLRPLGQGVYAETESSGAPILAYPQEDSTGRIVQGMLEGSNVSAMEEMIAMMNAQRAFEMTLNAVSASDEMASMANQTLKV